MWSVYILLRRVKAQHERYQASSILPLLSSPLPFSPLLSSSVHFTERGIGFAWCSFQWTMVSISRLAGLYICSGLVVDVCGSFAILRTTAETTMQLRSHRHIDTEKISDLFASTLRKCGSNCCGVWRGSLVLIRQQLWLHLSFVAEERRKKKKRGSSSNTKGGATFCVSRRDLVFCTEISAEHKLFRHHSYEVAI